MPQWAPDPRPSPIGQSAPILLVYPLGHGSFGTYQTERAPFMPRRPERLSFCLPLGSLEDDLLNPIANTPLRTQGGVPVR